MENKVPNFKKMARNLKKNAARYAASESVKFFRESFVKQGFTDSSFQAWAKSKSPMAGKRTLYRRGVLMRSVRKKEQTLERVVTHADCDHASIHNDGGEIAVTGKMNKFFWAMYYKFKGKNNKKADYWKGLALKKVGSKIKIPQHKFMGESKALMDKLDDFYRGEIVTTFKENINN